MGGPPWLAPPSMKRFLSKGRPRRTAHTGAPLTPRTLCYTVLDPARFDLGDHLMDCLHFRDELLEHIGQQRLRTIRQGLFGMVMNLHHYAVGARRDRRTRKRNHLVTFACSVRRID